MEGGHEFEPVAAGAAPRFLAGSLEILAMFDQVGAKRAHRPVFLDRIAVRHVNRDRHAKTAPRESKTLAVISRGGRDQPGDTGPLALQGIDIDKPTTHLEGAGRGMVLVLDDG